MRSKAHWRPAILGLHGMVGLHGTANGGLTNGEAARLHHWLGDTASLTLKLMQCSRQFRVQRLVQRSERCLADEAQRLGLARPVKAMVREVALLCDGVPFVFAHSVLPLTSSAQDWPWFDQLGERSLGSMLFADPQIVRGELEYARLSPQHPLAQRAVQAGMQSSQGLRARRRLFRRKQGIILVTEVFSPLIAQLTPQQARQPLHQDGYHDQ